MPKKRESKSVDDEADEVMFKRFAVGDFVQGCYKDGIWYRCEILEVEKHRVFVDFGSDDREWVPEHLWRANLVNRTIHLNNLPERWTGKFIIREIVDPRGQPQSIMGDWKFRECRPGIQEGVTVEVPRRMFEIKEMMKRDETFRDLFEASISQAKRIGCKIQKYLQSSFGMPPSHATSSVDAACTALEKLQTPISHESDTLPKCSQNEVETASIRPTPPMPTRVGSPAARQVRKPERSGPKNMRCRLVSAREQQQSVRSRGLMHRNGTIARRLRSGISSENSKYDEACAQTMHRKRGGVNLVGVRGVGSASCTKRRRDSTELRSDSRLQSCEQSCDENADNRNDLTMARSNTIADQTPPDCVQGDCNSRVPADTLPCCKEIQPVRISSNEACSAHTQSSNEHSYVVRESVNPSLPRETDSENSNHSDLFSQIAATSNAGQKVTAEIVIREKDRAAAQPLDRGPTEMDFQDGNGDVASGADKLSLLIKRALSCGVLQPSDEALWTQCALGLLSLGANTEKDRTKLQTALEEANETARTVHSFKCKQESLIQESQSVKSELARIQEELHRHALCTKSAREAALQANVKGPSNPWQLVVEKVQLAAQEAARISPSHSRAIQHEVKLFIEASIAHNKNLCVQDLLSEHEQLKDCIALHDKEAANQSRMASELKHRSLEVEERLRSVSCLLLHHEGALSLLHEICGTIKSFSKLQGSSEQHVGGSSQTFSGSFQHQPAHSGRGITRARRTMDPMEPQLALCEGAAEHACWLAGIAVHEANDEAKLH